MSSSPANPPLPPASAAPAEPPRARKVLALAIAGVLGVVLVGGAAVGLYALVTLPLPESFADPTRVALELRSARGDVFAMRGVAHGRPVGLDRLPDHLPGAFVAIEDRRFREHRGVDVRGMLRAALRNVRAGGVEQGGSTITQQLVKNSFLTPEKTLLRKIQEVLLATWIETRLSKDEILERYLDTLYLGAGAYGVDAASRRYFDKAADEVTLAEAALLAALAPAPSRLAPTRDPEAARRRAALVLDAMASEGFVSEESAEEAKANPARLAHAPVEASAFGYAADWAATEARTLLGGTSGDFVVRTTIEAPLQRLATSVVRQALEALPETFDVSQAALVAMRPDGRVVALVGGRDHRTSQFNRATQGKRQPGSVFKLFVYLAALEAGMHPTDTIEDAPIEVDGWSPQNYAGRYLGPISLSRAFARSSNAAAVRLQERIGRERVMALARRMGLSSDLASHPSLALGTVEATLLEMTAAFAAVRAHAERIEPWIVRTIESEGGASFRRPRRVLRGASWPKEEAYELLSRVVRSGTGRAAALEGTPAYGKTGTTQSYRDAWFVGFAEDLVVGVWVGNDDGTPTGGMTGGKLPAQIWHDFMEGALGDPAALVADDDSTTADGEVLLVGVPSVEDTGTFRVDGTVLRLEGVEGLGGRHATRMERYIGGREITCRPTVADRHRCEVDGWDLSKVVLFNGGGTATRDASPELAAAEEKARREGRGVWGE